jgi:3-carboxy-cis,cis-muconate cycloisomerase
MSDLFGELFVPEGLGEAVSDRAWLEAMLAFESALAHVEGELGVIPAEAAEAIVAACDAERFDPPAIGRAARAFGNPAAPLVQALTEAVAGEAAGYVHWGATSQDVMDTASMLVARQGLELLEHELHGVAVACAELADDHRGTVMPARTLMQQALPTTFGFKAAGWLVGVLDARRLLAGVRLAVELGGAAGTLAALGSAGPRVLAALAERLELEAPTVPWHSSRARVADLGASLAIAAGAAEKIARDVILLAQTEVGEVAEPADGDRGGSSTLPHKRNPVGSAVAIACAARVRAESSILVGAMAQEHERAAGAWQAEWEALSRALAYTGGAAAAMREVLDGLEVYPQRMRENLSEPVLAEAASMKLAESVGRGEAMRQVKKALESGSPLGDDLDPADYLGSAEAFVDRALERFRAEA